MSENFRSEELLRLAGSVIYFELTYCKTQNRIIVIPNSKNEEKQQKTNRYQQRRRRATAHMIRREYSKPSPLFIMTDKPQ